MEITLAVLADYANVTREGKLNILGIFHRIAVRELPATHPQMQLVLQVEAQYVERDRPHTVEIKLQEPDGGEVFEITGDVTPHGGEPGETLTMNQNITIGNLPLRKAGGHTIAIFIDRDLKSTVPLKIVLAGEDTSQPRLPGT